MELFAIAIFAVMLLSAATMVLQLTGVLELPDGALFCTLTPISKANCTRTGSAGIATLYLIPYSDIDHSTGITWDADEQATAIPLVTAKTWTKYEFELGTAFFNQEKSVVGNNINFVQTISINFANNDNTTRSALKAMDACCELVAYIVDNQGNTRLAGILPVAAGGTDSRSLELNTGAGTYNTGADPTADQNVRTVTLTCNSPYEAPFTTVSESSLALT